MSGGRKVHVAPLSACEALRKTLASMDFKHPFEAVEKHFLSLKRIILMETISVRRVLPHGVSRHSEQMLQRFGVVFSKSILASSDLEMKS